MGIARQFSFATHTMEAYDVPGYYLVDKVPVLSGNLKLESLSAYELQQLFGAAANVWQPSFAVMKRVDGYYICSYMGAFDDRVWDGRAVVDGVLVHYDRENMDIHDPVAIEAVHRIADRIRHGGIAVWKQENRLYTNLVPFAEWSPSVQQVFETVGGDVSWRM